MGDVKLDIDIEQCRENDKIKELISTSGLPIKYIKILLRLADAIYLNAINYNVRIKDGEVSILLVSSKGENEFGRFTTSALTNVFYRIRELEKKHEDIDTKCRVHDGILEVQFKFA
ncbi:MAG: Uncharacterized protein XD44_0271 [Methanobacteriaceae archaeon 41_258]|nr:MAG: Uncharacterized protein XD44_0271 [Methanobacteriaceae archaeon 41_258]